MAIRIVFLPTQFEVEHYNAPGYKTVPPIFNAICRNNTEIVQCFLEAGADTSLLMESPDCGVFVLRGAIRSENRDLVSLLLNSGILLQNMMFIQTDTSRSETILFPTILHYAVFYGSINVAKELLRTDWYSNVLHAGPYQWALLRDAAKNGDFDIVGVLISAGVDLDGTGEQCTSKYTTQQNGVKFGLRATEPFWGKDY